MLIPNPDVLPLSLQDSIEAGLEHLEALEEDGALDGIMSPSYNHVWEYPDRFQYRCMGWHQFGTA